MKNKYSMRVSKIILPCMLVMANITAPSAATPEEIESSIAKGLSWLVTQQQADGSWDDIPISTSGLALLKLEDRAKELKKDPFDSSQYEYADNVIKGLDFLFSQAMIDANGIHFADFGSYEVYSTGIAMMAVAASNAPGRVITTGALAGSTYQQALQGMMNWLVYAQNKAGDGSDCDAGGWGYQAVYPGWSDQSNSGYASLGLGFASAAAPAGFGLTIPPATLAQLDTYINAVQVDSGDYAGGSIYEPCSGFNWVNTLKTGNMLYELGLVGANKADGRVQAAVNFIQNYWKAPAGVYDGGGWIGDYQAMFTMMKGLQALGIEEITVDGNPIHWFDEVSSYIVANQTPAGNWLHTTGEGTSTTLDTVWALLTLEKVVPTFTTEVAVDVHPTSCPNPINTRSKGVTPVAILGTEEFDVSQVNPATVQLFRDQTSSVAPQKWAIGDVATPYSPFLDKPLDSQACNADYADGYLDLSLKFSTQALVSALGAVNDREVIKLKLTGNLKEEFGGTRIQGEDVIVILKK